MKWNIYQMRCITTLAKLRGGLVHDIISGALRAVRHGRLVNIEEAKQNVTDILLQKLRESYYRIWADYDRRQGRKQADICNLHEHYFGYPDVDQKARESRAIAWQCLENAMGGELWESIVNSDPKEWMEIEEEGFPHFDLEGIKVYSIIDFAHKCDQPTIIDWKTGTPIPSDREQLLVYSLYAESRWGWKPEEIALKAVYLYPDYRIEECRANAEEIESARQMIKQSFDEMLSLESAYGPVDMNDFPCADNSRYCEWCRFRKLCGFVG